MIIFLRNAFFIIFTLILIGSLTKNLLDYKSKIQFFHTYQKDLDEQKKKKIELQSQIAKSKDYYSREKDIRNKLNLLKSDEVMIILPVTPAPKAPQVEEKSNWKKWLELFI